MGMSNHLHATALLTHAKNLPLFTEQKTAWDQESVWVPRRREERSGRALTS
jgi:hypothetical protein